MSGSTSVASSGAASSSAPAPRNSSLVAPGSTKSRSKNGKSMGASAAAAGKPDLIQPANAALPTHDGQSTLTRTLGLKIGRIVIDAGHGGHDTRTIGPPRPMEKDLFLDVAVRLRQNIPAPPPRGTRVY